MTRIKTRNEKRQKTRMSYSRHFGLFFLRVLIYFWQFSGHGFTNNGEEHRQDYICLHSNRRQTGNSWQPKASGSLGDGDLVGIRTFLVHLQHMQDMLTTSLFNPCPDGPLDFPPPDVEGGGVLRTPLCYYFPRRHNETQKSVFEGLSEIITFVFSQFFAKVNIEVTRGQ